MDESEKLSELQKGMIIGFRAKGGTVSETAEFVNCSSAAVEKEYREWTNDTIPNKRRLTSGASRAIDASGGNPREFSRQKNTKKQSNFYKDRRNKDGLSAATQTPRIPEVKAENHHPDEPR